MSKKTQTAPAFAIGDRVIATTAATLQEPATGTIADISKTGWLIVQLDDSNATAVLANTKGRISARAGSLQHLDAAKEAPAADSLAGQLAAANAPAPKGKAKKADPEAEEANVCPECGADGLEWLGGGAGCECPECGWVGKPEDEDEEGPSKMAEALRKARGHYTKDRRPDGSQTAHCNDAIARELRDLEPLEVAELADRVLQQPIGFHAGKYDHLNNGQIRMNSGNRIRGYWKNINEDGNEAEIARVMALIGIEAPAEDDNEEAQD